MQGSASSSRLVAEVVDGRSQAREVHAYMQESSPSHAFHTSADVSPAPSAWPSMQPSTASQTLSPHQLAMHQQHLAETAGKTPVHELIAQIKKLPFPALCGFVLGLLEK